MNEYEKEATLLLIDALKGCIAGKEGNSYLSLEASILEMNEGWILQEEEIKDIILLIDDILDDDSKMKGNIFEAISIYQEEFYEDALPSIEEVLHPIDEDLSLSLIDIWERDIEMVATIDERYPDNDR